MPFTDSSWVQVEAFIDNAWVNVTADVDDVDGGGRISGTKGVTLTAGRSLGAQRANSRQCDFTIFNRDGKYAGRNPRSPYWGLLPLNTPVRVRALPYESYVQFHSATDTSVPAYAFDSATLDITGDMELRLDFEPEQGIGNTGGGIYTYTVVSKWWSDGNQRSWILVLSGGIPLLWWSPDGTLANARFLTATTRIPDGRISLKVQLDVNNGAGGVSATFSTATSIDGTYAQLGSVATSAGTTSIFSSTADLTFTADHNGTIGLQYANSQKFQGKIFCFRLYSNLTGTLAAEADFSDLEPGDSFYDDGTTDWFIVNNSTGYVASDKLRFYGFIPKWPVAAANSTNIYSDIHAAGLFNLLSNGALDLDSPMFRYYSTLENVLGYWSGEDGSDATSLSASDTATRAASALNVTFAAQGDLPGSKDLLTITTNSAIQGRFKSYTSTGEWAFTFCMYLNATPVADVPMLYIATSNGMQVKFTVGTTTYLTQIYSSDGTLLSSQNSLYGAGAAPGQWIIVVFEFVQNGGNVDWAVNWRATDPDINYAHGASYADTLGRLIGFTIPAVPAAASLSTVSVGHIAGNTTVDDFLESAHVRSFRGYVQETDIERMTRLCGELNIPLIIRGVAADGVEMGKQGIKTPLGLFDDCAAAARAVLIETRFQNGLTYITRRELTDYYTRDIDYSGGELLDAKVDDDSIPPINYVTVTRDNGGSSTAITTTGPRSISVGTFGDPQSFNLYADEQTRDTAEWMRHIGSWDEERWTGMRFELAKPVIRDDPTLLAAMYGFDLLKVIRVLNPPDYLPVREPECLIEEYTEVLTRPSHVIEFGSSPARPYAVASFIDARVRVGSSESRVSTAMNTSTTTLVVESSSPYTEWEFSSSFYISVSDDKERMLVTAISGTNSPWTFTVTRGTPSFSHAVDGTVRLWDQRVIGY